MYCGHGLNPLEVYLVKLGFHYGLIAIMINCYRVIANENVFNYRVKPRKFTISNCDDREKVWFSLWVYHDKGDNDKSFAKSQSR